MFLFKIYLKSGQTYTLPFMPNHKVDKDKFTQRQPIFESQKKNFTKICSLHSDEKETNYTRVSIRLNA